MGFRQAKGIYANLDKSSPGEKSGVELSVEENILAETSEESDALNKDFLDDSGVEDTEDDLETQPIEIDGETGDNVLVEVNSLQNALKVLIEKGSEQTTDSIPIKRRYNKNKNNKKQASKIKKSVIKQT